MPNLERKILLKKTKARNRVQFETSGKPWRTVGTKNLIELGEIRLFEDRLVSKTGIRARHLKLNLHDFSIIVPLLPRNRLVFEWNYRHVLGGWELELPAGLMETGETPKNCAKRELEEETGYTGGSWREVGWVHTLPGITGQRAYVFLATRLRHGRPRREVNEMMRMKTLSVREAYRLLNTGRIVHAPTVVALSLARPELGDYRMIK